MLPNDKSYEIIDMYQYSDDKEKNGVITIGADMVLIVIQRVR